MPRCFVDVLCRQRSRPRQRGGLPIACAGMCVLHRRNEPCGSQSGGVASRAMATGCACHVNFCMALLT